MSDMKSLKAELEKLFAEFKDTVTDKIRNESKNIIDPLVQQKLDAIAAEMTEKKAQLDQIGTIIERQTELEGTIARLEKVGASGHEDASDARAALRAFNLELRSHQTATGRPAPADVDAEGFEAYRKNFGLWLRRGDKSADIEFRAMSVGSDPDGGYLVTPDMSGRIVKRIYETSPVRQYASVMSISTDALEGLRDTDTAAGGWVAETGSRAASTTPQLGAWRIPVHEIYSNPGASQKLLDDANIDVEAWLAMKVADYFARTQNTAFVTGSGVGQPRGFASYTTAATADTSRAWGVMEHVATGSAGGWGSDPNGINKLVSLIGAMNQAYLGGSAFYANRVTITKWRQVTDASSAGKFVFIPSFQANIPDTVMGYPVRQMQDMVDYTTTNSLAVAFGDLRETYQIVDRIGIRTLRDPYTNKPYVQFYTTARVGGDVVNFNSLKFLKFGTS